MTASFDRYLPELEGGSTVLGLLEYISGKIAIPDSEPRRRTLSPLHGAQSVRTGLKVGRKATIAAAAG